MAEMNHETRKLYRRRKASFGVVSGDGVVTMNEQLGGTLRHAARRARGRRRRRDKEARRTAPSPTTSSPTSSSCRSSPTRKKSSASASTTSPTPPSTAPRRRSCRTSSPNSSTRWWRMKARCCGPKVSTSFDFEGELALVIGKGGRHIKAADALKHVAGYTCFCDGSVRDFTKYSLVASKNFPRTSPLGPWMVTVGRNSRSDQAHAGDAAQRQGDAALRHRHADPFDSRRSSSSARCSRSSSPGDIIATGTPDGIGAKRIRRSG